MNPCCSPSLWPLVFINLHTGKNPNTSVGSKNCHVPATAAPEQCLNRKAAGTGPRPAGLHRNRLAACWPLWPGTGQPWQAALLHRNRPAPRPKQPILAKTNLGQMLHPQWACKHATPAASANPRAHESKGMQIQGCTNHKLKGVQIQGCVNSRVHELRACESRTQDRACKLRACGFKGMQTQLFKSVQIQLRVCKLRACKFKRHPKQHRFDQQPARIDTALSVSAAQQRLHVLACKF